MAGWSFLHPPASLSSKHFVSKEQCRSGTHSIVLLTRATSIYCCESMECFIVTLITDSYGGHIVLVTGNQNHSRRGIGSSEAKARTRENYESVDTLALFQAINSVRKEHRFIFPENVSANPRTYGSLCVYHYSNGHNSVELCFKYISWIITVSTPFPCRTRTRVITVPPPQSNKWYVWYHIHINTKTFRN